MTNTKTNPRISEIETEIEKLPFTLLTHCAICGKAFSLVKLEVEFELGMGYHVNPDEIKRAIIDLEIKCNC